VLKEDGLANKQQRIIVITDEDFENGDNLDLAMRSINWLSEDDDFISTLTRAL